MQLIVVLLQQLDQKSGCACLKPIVIELFFCKCIEQAEWIVNAYTVLPEMITVVLLAQPLACLFEGHAVGIGKFADGVVKVNVQFFFRYATDVHIAGIHGDVIQIV